MKILAIRGKNLASLEGEFEVDFTTEPLRSAGIFAITGATGSGKSTLLDAICLALYNDTPRINRAADNADITDVKESTIKQKDSRNILRRGTIDGYAEIDFLSLSGDRYRARWSVRRSRNRIDGSLQAATYNLYNLETNSEEQGTKTELLKKVVELVGLTFDQFTRAVLLAQGDFATFLKAGKNEKAELLEKLTGTDIYSRISSKIYDNTKQAESELLLITDKIKGIDILTDEQIAQLCFERDETIKSNELLGIKIKILESKIEWINKNVELNNSANIAKKTLDACLEAINSAKERALYLARVESTASIRDNFRQLESDNKLLTKDKQSIEQQNNLLNTHNIELKKVNTELITLEKTKKELTVKWQQLEPLLIQARHLDTQIEGISTNLIEATKEKEQVTKERDKLLETIDKNKIEIDKSEKEQTLISDWFNHHKLYSDIVGRIELVSSYITDTTSAKQQIASNEKLLTSSSKLLEQEEAELKNQQEEAKRLNDILPEEIAQLRQKLIDGEPCPVCGSTLHPSSTQISDTLEQEALTRNKELTKSEIERISQSIQKRKESIIEAKSHITNYKEHFDKTFNKLIEIVQDIPDWKNKYNNGTLNDFLKNIASFWSENINKKDTLKEKLVTQKQELISQQERYCEIEKSKSDKQTKLNTISSTLGQLKHERESILEGKSANETQNAHQSAANEIENKIKNTSEMQSLIVAKTENAAGVISQLTDNIIRLEKSVKNHSQSIENWLLQRKDNLTFDNLSELISKDSNWIDAERTALKKLAEDELTAKTTLSERERVLAEHQNGENKPTDDQTKDSLTTILETNKSEFTSKHERITQIAFTFTENDKNKARIKQFEKELTEKSEKSNNWLKLNELYGSANGDKFKILAQGYTLDVLLGYANKHLKDISDRYILERVSPESLSLQVVDLDMLSEVRSVHSLSGGESFLISLALALGLSSLSSNRMRIESLFIDEGFGTLDADTLRIAMEALERLQTMGRTIGVISHVAEMTERIPTQIRVIKAKNGKSLIKIN